MEVLIGSLKTIRSKVLRLVRTAREEARVRLSNAGFDRLGFSDDLDGEFDDDPSAFYAKYREYLIELTDDEHAVFRDHAP
jgi:hypothetical protein